MIAFRGRHPDRQLLRLELGCRDIELHRTQSKGEFITVGRIIAALGGRAIFKRQMLATVKAKPSKKGPKVVEFTHRTFFDPDREQLKADMLAAGMDPSTPPPAYPAQGTTLPRTAGS